MSYRCGDCGGSRVDSDGLPCAECRGRGYIADDCDAEGTPLSEVEGDELDAALSGLDPEHPVRTGL